MKIKKFNESVFNTLVEQRIDECISMIGSSFNLEVKDKDAAKKDLVEFIKKNYIIREQDGTNNSGEFYF
jgi:hypothetical protein